MKIQIGKKYKKNKYIDNTKKYIKIYTQYTQTENIQTYKTHIYNKQIQSYIQKIEIVNIDTQREITDVTNDTYINLEYTINTVSTHNTNMLRDT